MTGTSATERSLSSISTIRRNFRSYLTRSKSKPYKLSFLANLLTVRTIGNLHHEAPLLPEFFASEASSSSDVR